MLEMTEADDLFMLSTPSVRLEFSWTGDRFAHRILSMHEQSPRPLVSSLEVSTDRFDLNSIASPTFQEVTLHQDANLLVALAVGKFGKIHFAGTFRVEYWPSGHRRSDGFGPTDKSERIGTPMTSIEVDLAARCSEPMRHLASTYTVHAPPAELAFGLESAVGWCLQGHPRKLVLERGSESPIGTYVQVDEAGRAACRAQVVMTPAQEARSHRLKYAWMISDNAETICLP